MIGQALIIAQGPKEMIKGDDAIILLQVIQMLQEQAKPDVLLMRVVIGRLVIFDHTVITEDRRLSSIEPGEQIDHTSSFQKGKEKPFHAKPVFPSGLSRRCETALPDRITTRLRQESHST